MSNKIAVLAASVPLMLAATGAFAGDFQAPTTERGRQMQPLLSRAANAVHDKIASTAGGRISSLWLYPTSDDHTVFAQYIVTTEPTSTGQEHLELLTMQGDRVVEEHDLARMGSDTALRAQQVSGGRDWSASIGDGHTTSTTVQTPAVATGSPASAHWSALIGSGHGGEDGTQRLQVIGNVAASHLPHAHWTSKIGTARAADSDTNAQNGKSPS